MGASTWTQSSFLGGEWSPYAQGRIDEPVYRMAMNVCRNGFPIEEGAWLRRSGTQFAQTTLNGQPGRVMRFDFEDNNPYIMEFTNTALRMFAVNDAFAGLINPLANQFRLVTTNDGHSLSGGATGISTDTPAIVTVSPHTWNTGDQVMILLDTSLPASFATYVRNRVFAITVIDSQHFSLTDPITGLPVNGTLINWSQPALNTAIVVRVLNIVTPYAIADVPLLRRVQAEQSAILLHGSYQPQMLTATTLPTSAAAATFSLAIRGFADGPYLDPPTDGSTLTNSGTSGSITLTASAITSINGGAGFVSTDVGRSVRLLSEPPAWSSGTAYTAGESVTYSGTYFTCTQNNTGQEPDIAIAYWSINTAAATWTWCNITAVTNATTVTAFVDGVALLYTAAMTTWQLGVYSNTTGWPTCGLYYEGRLWLAGAISNRVDASNVNDLFNFSPTAVDGTIADSNAISYIFNAEDVNPIYWFIGTSQGIVAGTQSGEWLIQASALNDPITPTSIQAHRVTKFGCANIEPEHTELTISFVHRYRRKVLEYFPDVFSGRYTAPNLSKNAKHLTTSGIEEIRYQRELLPVIWGRCGNGSLIGCTYKRISLFSTQGPEFTAWHRHDLGSGRTVQSISVGPSVDGDLDTLSMVTFDPATGVYHVELMNNLFDVDAPITSGWFVDDAVVPSGGVYATSNGASTVTFYGLWHLNGKTVTVTCGGVDCGDYAVANGSVSVPIDTDINALFTTVYLTSISSQSAFGSMAVPIDYPSGNRLWVPAAIGFTYTSQGQGLRPDTVDQQRSPLGPGLGKKRRSAQFGALLAGAQGVSFGTSFSKLNAANFMSPGGTVPLTKLQLFSGVYQSTLTDDSSFDGMFAWQISRPYPCALDSYNAFMVANEI